MTDQPLQQDLVRQLVIARPLLEQTFRQLLRDQEVVALGRAGINRTAHQVEYICGESRASARGSLHGPPVHFAWALQDRDAQRRRLLSLRSQFQGGNASPIILITLEREPVRGRLRNFVATRSGEIEPIHSLKIVGPGMYRERTSDAPSLLLNQLTLTRHEREKWSRVAGALGEGAWQRLRSLHYCIIGVGRTGSLVASTLTKLGIDQITLIDADHLELHNIDSMDGVTERDVGRLKVSAVRDYLRLLTGKEGASKTLAESITSLRAFGAAKEADVLISCVDHDGARLATAMIATFYAKPMLDFGTGVFYEGRTSENQPTQRRMGGDFRLILPYERCLLCFGGLANMTAAASIFESQQNTPAVPWNLQCAGSLRSLNQIVAHSGVTQLQDFVDERVTESRWLHFEVADDGIPAISAIDPPRTPNCLCNFYAVGDEGLSRISEIKEALTRATTL